MRSAKSASPRDSKREYSAALITGAGTPSSIAACSVQRPSPESETRPWKLPSSGSCRNASAVRSSSHEPTTLPRRHISATCATSISYCSDRVAQWRSLGIHLCWRRPILAFLMMLNPSAIRGHHAILDAVVDHLYEVAGPIWTAMEIAILGLSRRSPVAPGVRGAASTPGASERKIGSRCFTIASSPPIIWQ